LHLVTRLLLLTPDFPPAIGGIQLLLGRLASHLSEDFDVTVMTRRGANPVELDESPSGGVVVRSTRLTGQPGLIAANALGLAIGARGSFDIVLSGHITTSPAAACLKHLQGVPFVQYTYADEVPNRPKLARFAMRQAARTIAISVHTRALAVEAGCPPDRVELIAPGVDIPTALPARQRSSRPTIITVARLEDRYKGHDVMLHALALVSKRVPDVLWSIVGGGSLRRELEASAARLGLADHVEFAGRVSDGERDRRLAAAHVFAMPSRLPPSGTEGGEGFGIVYLEAGLHGLPVVAGRVGGALDAIVHGVTGLLVDPTSAAELADAISVLLLDSDRARMLGEAGALHAREFSWERMSRGVHAVLTSALASST
jgi:phosphatidylinositol alpha-1,6-mannosyltransferase